MAVALAVFGNQNEISGTTWLKIKTTVTNTEILKCILN